MSVRLNHHLLDSVSTMSNPAVTVKSKNIHGTGVSLLLATQRESIFIPPQTLANSKTWVLPAMDHLHDMIQDPDHKAEKLLFELFFATNNYFCDYVHSRRLKDLCSQKFLAVPTSC